MPEISVCIVASRPAWLRRCLATLAAQHDAPSFEVVVGVRAIDDRWRDAASVLPGAKLIAASGLPGDARNEVVRAAAGDLLLFVDDDVTVHPEMLRRLSAVARSHPEAEVFGGPNATPAGSSFFQAVQGAVLGSIVASGPVRRRYGKHPPGSADERFFILCNLAIRRRSMRDFPRDLICAEENALLAEMSRRGLGMHYDPELVVWHERRPDFRGFAAQMHKYGFGRGQLVRRHPSQTRAAYVVPSVGLVYIAALPALAFVTPRAALPLGVYAAAAAANGCKVAMTLRRPRAAAPATVLTVTLHVCYATGVLRGIVAPRRRPAARRAIAAPDVGERDDRISDVAR